MLQRGRGQRTQRGQPELGRQRCGEARAQEPAWATHRHATPWAAEIDGAERSAPRAAEGSRALATGSGVQCRRARWLWRWWRWWTLDAGDPVARRQPLPEAATTLSAQYTGRPSPSFRGPLLRRRCRPWCRAAEVVAVVTGRRLRRPGNGTPEEAASRPTPGCNPERETRRHFFANASRIRSRSAARFAFAGVTLRASEWAPVV